jgi:hypothetical protein
LREGGQHQAALRPLLKGAAAGQQVAEAVAEWLLGMV